VNTRPLDWGIDLVVHSATKYLGGHNDLLAGFIAGRDELIKPIRESIGILGGISDPNTAYLLLRGMKTLAIRVEQQNRTAQQVVEFLAGHPAVEAVYYPGLCTHPGHELAAQQMKGFGGLLSLKVRGDLQAAYRFIDALKVFFISPSLGGLESLVIHLATQAYYDCTPQERLLAGIPDNLVRLAIGLEDAQDLIADLDQALNGIRSPL
ncbi:MAG: PLP-dependent transferase, partial [Anaerolineaceae bacterium]|nr:PLP-dependent transferase [Anaerolineaceae bacterium]